MSTTGQQPRRRDYVPILIIVSMAAVVILVLWRILFPPDPVSIVISDENASDYTSAAAALSMGQRMGQSAEWTIATILVVGTALIGLNWYQADRRYQRDMEDMNHRIGAIESQVQDRFQRVEFASSATLMFLMVKGLSEQIGSPDEIGFVEKDITQFRRQSSPEARHAIALVLVEWARARQMSDPTLPIMGEIPLLREFVPELTAHFPELAQQISEALDLAATF